MFLMRKKALDKVKHQALNSNLPQMIKKVTFAIKHFTITYISICWGKPTKSRQK